MLIDNHGREINYLRLAVTDRCNLRCFYCMPENGIKYMNRKDLLTFEEMIRLIRVFGDLGVSKIRITGGEPFVRKGIMSFLKGVSELATIKEINITTNGTFTVEQIPALEKMGILSIPFLIGPGLQCSSAMECLKNISVLKFSQDRTDCRLLSTISVSQ